MVKNRQENRNQFVFTVDEDIHSKSQLKPKPIDRYGSSTKQNEAKPAWEQTLEQMRQRKKKTEGTHSLSAFAVSKQRSQPIPSSTVNKKYGQEINVHPKVTKTAVSGNIQPTTTAKTTVPLQKSGDVLLDPVQREQAYRTYLKQWQQKHSMEIQQQESALNDTALLIQEDWLAAQHCLQSAVDVNTPSTCTISLQGKDCQVVAEKQVDPQAENLNKANSEHDNNQSIVHVHMHVIEPRGVANRGVACISEQELLQQLSEKLRPHLADVLAGMVRVAVQRHTAGLVTTLQRELLAEVPSAVDDVLKHNLVLVMNKIKKGLY